MKDWPSDETATVDAEELITPVMAALRFAYELRRRNRDADVPYDGHDQGESSRANCLSPADQLKAENLIYSEEDQGREADEEILAIMFRLGIEQGRRMERKDGRHLELRLAACEALLARERGE